MKNTGLKLLPYNLKENAKSVWECYRKLEKIHSLRYTFISMIFQGKDFFKFLEYLEIMITIFTLIKLFLCFLRKYLRLTYKIVKKENNKFSRLIKKYSIF